MKVLAKALPLAGAALIAAMALAASPASAAITITPANTAFTATLTSSAVFTAANGLAVTCTGSTAAGTTGASGPSVSFAPPTFTGCTASSGNSASVIVTSTAACNWTLTITSVSGTGSSGAATAPGGCLMIEITLGGKPLCTMTVSATTVAVTYVNATTSLKTDLPNSVPYTATGGLCGGNGTATYAAQYSISPSSFQATIT